MIGVRAAELADKAALSALFWPYRLELAQVGAAEAGYYPDLELYWTGPDRWPYLFEVGARPAGLALVNRWSPSGLGVDHAIAEFYIAPAFRRSGLGRAAAVQLLALRPGLWELAAFRTNAPAVAFWPGAIAAAGAVGHSVIAREEEYVHRFRVGLSRLV